jgi:hypothetical protein
MTGFQTIKNFFNSKVSNKIFTRAEYFQALKKSKLKDSYLDTVRCYFVNAGYLLDEEPGVYRKLKKIPSNLTLTKLQDEAYPDTIQKRNETRRLASQYRY